MTELINKINRRKQSESEYLKSHYERRDGVYRIIPANTPELRRIYYELRYLVYCIEYEGYEEQNHFTNIEIDKYDDYSESFLLVYNPLHMVIGGTRLILPDPSKKNFGLPALEIENSPLLLDSNHDFSQFAEVSRFLLSKTRMKLIAKYEDNKRDYSVYPSPLQCLIRCVFDIVQKNNLMGVVAVLSPLLINLIKRLGIMVNTVGEPFEYHGKRQCIYFLVDEYLEWARDNNVKNYHLFTDLCRLD